MYIILYNVYSVQYTVYSIQYTVYCTGYTTFSMQYSVYSIQLRVYSIQHTVFSPSSARMAGAGTAYKLIGTFLKLKKACTKAFLSFDSYSDGDMQVTLKVLVPGLDNQVPGGGAVSPGDRR